MAAIVRPTSQPSAIRFKASRRVMYLLGVRDRESESKKGKEALENRILEFIYAESYLAMYPTLHFEEVGTFHNSYNSMKILVAFDVTRAAKCW